MIFYLNRINDKLRTNTLEVKKGIRSNEGKLQANVCLQQYEWVLHLNTARDTSFGLRLMS